MYHRLPTRTKQKRPGYAASAAWLAWHAGRDPGAAVLTPADAPRDREGDEIACFIKGDGRGTPGS